MNIAFSVLKNLFILSVIPLCGLFVSCSKSVCSGNGVGTVARLIPDTPGRPWYQCFKDEKGETMFITRSRILYEFDHELGYWKAYGAEDKKLYMIASGRTFTIQPEYVWDGATEGPTTAKLLTPTLFHDALLHAKMNGAPITQGQADGAFLQLMRKERFFFSRPYYSLAKNFGGRYAKEQIPRTLKIVSTR